MSAPALCREWWANLGARARAGVIFFPPRVRVLPPYTLVYFLASQSGGLFRFFLPTETDPCAVAFSFSSRDNFQLLRYCICTCNRITRVTVSLCITLLYSITLYQRITVHCISLYTVCMYHSVSLYVSLHSITLYQRITVHCITVGCTAPHEARSRSLRSHRSRQAAGHARTRTATRNPL